MKYFDEEQILLEDRVFHITSSNDFMNNTKVNTNIIDTLENSIIDFSKSNNVSFNGKENSVSLTDSTLSGYFVTNKIYPYITNSSLNNFFIHSNHSINNGVIQGTQANVRYFVITDTNEEFEIVCGSELRFLNDIKYFNIKCILEPSSNNFSPTVYGYSVCFKDKSIFDLNKTNI